MDLDSAVTELYGLVPEEFMDARKRLGLGAKSDGDAGLAKAIDSVRKPTAAAWALNQLVRQRPDELEQLLTLAASLQDASERMDGAAMRDLGRERTRLIDELVRATSDVASEAGGSLSMPVADQVRQTFVAALASPPAAEAVASGRLTRGLTYAGFGDVDLSEATAAPSPNRRPALRVIRGEKRGRSGRQRDDEAEDETPEEVDPEEVEPEEVELEADDEPQGPDPALLERLSAAETRTRQTTAEAAAAGAALTTATDSLAAVDLRITELDAALKAARAERDDLVGRRAEAAAADKAAQRTLRASFAELDAVQALLPDEDDA